MRFKHTVPCIRPEMPAWTDDFGNVVGESRAVVNFRAAFFPPTTMAGSQIIDGVLRETTVTKPTLMVEPTSANTAAFAAGAIKSTDPLTVNGEAGWEVDGDPAPWVNAQSGRLHPLLIELRRTAG